MEQSGSISLSEAPINSIFYAGPGTQASSSVLPQNLLDPKAHSSFENNLSQATNGGDADDTLDPLLTSRHLEPHAKKREEEEEKSGRVEEGPGTRKTGHKHGSSGGGQAGSPMRIRGRNPEGLSPISTE